MKACRFPAAHDFESPGNYGVEIPHRLGLLKGVLDRLNYDDSRSAIPGAPAMPLAPPIQPAPAPMSPFPGGTQGAPGLDGKATVRLTFDNPQPNMRASTVAQGGLRVETPTLRLVP